MSFTSSGFLLFLAVLVPLYWSLRGRAQTVVLLAASLAFYGSIHPWYPALVVTAAMAAYLATNAMAWRPRWGALWLTAGVAANLGLLGAFKYLGLFVNAVGDAGLVAVTPALRDVLPVVVPVGLAFYTLQLTGYVIDVHRGDVDGRRDPLTVALFACFFPLLIAGPIERAGNIFPQLERKRCLSAMEAHDGLVLVLWGAFKKLVIADNVAVVADKVFALDQPGFSLLWAGVFAFAIQIYADFSGYSDIARGVARWFGIDVMSNFRHPYGAISPSDFWRRWHVSLSSWLRDYVFFPSLMRLGATRLAAAVAVVITFLVSGMWHGAGWTFIAWGLYHAVLLIGERVAGSIAPRARPASTAVRRVVTFGLVCIGWLIFREPDLARLTQHLCLVPWADTMVQVRAGLFFFTLSLVYSVPLWLAMGLEVPASRARLGLPGLAPSPALRWGVRTVASTALFTAILVARGPVSFDFIYSRF